MANGWEQRIPAGLGKANSTWPAPGVYREGQATTAICVVCGQEGGRFLMIYEDGKYYHPNCAPPINQGRDSGDEHEHCDRRKPQTIDDLREERRQKASLLTQIREMRADLSRAQRCLEAVKRSLDDLEEAVGPR
jgi:hypothetical protein